ncbi:hypothetical protein QJQ45_021572, partial [Haematococcus lacustris]
SPLPSSPEVHVRDLVDDVSEADGQGADGFFVAAATAKSVHQPVLATRRITTVLEPQPSPPQTAHAFHSLVLRGFGGAGAAGMTIALLVAAALRIGLWLCSGSWWQLGATWLAVELGFYVWFQNHCAELEAQPVPHAPAHQDPVLNFKRLHAHAKFHREVCHTPINWRNYLSTWFCGAPVSQIKLGNLREMVAYGFYYATPSQLQAEGRWHEVCSMVDMLSQIAAPGPTPPTAPIPPTLSYPPPLSVEQPPTAPATPSPWALSPQDPLGPHTPDGSPRDEVPSLPPNLAAPTPPSPFGAVKAVDQGLLGGGPCQAGHGSSTPPPPTPSCAPLSPVLEPSSEGSGAASPSLGQGHHPPSVAAAMAAAVRPGGSGLATEEECYVVLGEGYTPGLRFMAHLWEPLRYSHRGQGPVLSRAVPGQGADQGSAEANDQEGSAEQLAADGLCSPPLPPPELLCQLAAPGGPLLAPEVGHVSLRLCRTVPSACQVAAKVVAMMDRLRLPPTGLALVLLHPAARAWLRAPLPAATPVPPPPSCSSQACVVAHSYGTFVASRLVQAHGPRAVRSLALIDPVCFGMFLPSLLHSFVYRTPWSAFKAKGLLAALKAAFIHFVARDVHAAATFCRGFYWTDVNLWPEELPPRCLVVLAGRDELLHAEEVRQVVSGGYVGITREPHPMRLPPPPSPSPPQAGGGPGHMPAQDSSSSSSSRGGVSPYATLSQAVAEASAASRGAHARILWHPTASHAGFLFNMAWQGEVVEQVLVLAREEAVQPYVSRRKTTVQALAPLHALHALHSPPRGPLASHPLALSFSSTPGPPDRLPRPLTGSSPSSSASGSARQPAAPGAGPPSVARPPLPPSACSPPGASRLGATATWSPQAVARTRTVAVHRPPPLCGEISPVADKAGGSGAAGALMPLPGPGLGHAGGVAGGQGVGRAGEAAEQSSPGRSVADVAAAGSELHGVGVVRRRHTIREGITPSLLAPGGGDGSGDQGEGLRESRLRGSGERLGKVGGAAAAGGEAEVKQRGGLAGLKEQQGGSRGGLSPSPPPHDSSPSQGQPGAGSGVGTPPPQPLSSYVSAPGKGWRWEEEAGEAEGVGGAGGLEQVAASLSKAAFASSVPDRRCADTCSRPAAVLRANRAFEVVQSVREALQPQVGLRRNLRLRLLPRTRHEQRTALPLQADTFSALNLPEALVHWGHPGNMMVVLLAMGGYGAGYLGWQIRNSSGGAALQTAKDMHPKLAAGMTFFFAAGAAGGVLSLMMQGRPIFESGHAVSGLLGLGLLAVQASLPTVFASGGAAARTAHAYLGTAILALFAVHAVQGIQLGLSI